MDRLQASRRQTEKTQGGHGHLPSTPCICHRGRWGMQAGCGTMWFSPSTKLSHLLCRRLRIDQQTSRGETTREENSLKDRVGLGGASCLQTLFCGAQTDEWAKPSLGAGCLSAELGKQEEGMPSDILLNCVGVVAPRNPR